MDEGSAYEAEDAMNDLSDWIASGGFLPTIEAVATEQNMARLQAFACAMSWVPVDVVMDIATLYANDISGGSMTWTMTGGGVGTLYVDIAESTVVIGPGFYDGRGLEADLALSVGPRFDHDNDAWQAEWTDTIDLTTADGPAALHEWLYSVAND